jgi:hypothetical protein
MPAGVGAAERMGGEVRFSGHAACLYSTFMAVLLASVLIVCVCVWIVSLCEEIWVGVLGCIREQGRAIGRGSYDDSATNSVECSLGLQVH